MDQQPPEIAVSAFADPSKAFFAARRMLPWDETKPRREVSSRFEVRRLPHGGDQCCRCDNANAGNGHQSSTSIASLHDFHQIAINTEELSAAFSAGLASRARDEGLTPPAASLP
jgi:hypothetical protein